MNQKADRDKFEEVRLNVIERALYVGKAPTQEALALQRGYSLRKSLVQDVAQAALQHCLVAGQDVHAFSELAWSGISVVNSLEHSLTEHKRFDFSENAQRDFNWNFWKHDDRPHVRISERKFPYMDRFGIEDAARSYLDLPYRAPLLERTIVDVLIAVELYAFSEEMLETMPVGLRWLTRSPPRRKVRELMLDMAHTYRELSGDGQVSTRRLREVAARAADNGVGWPKVLFLILDDNIARSGRI